MASAAAAAAIIDLKLSTVHAIGKAGDEIKEPNPLKDRDRYCLGAPYAIAPFTDPDRSEDGATGLLVADQISQTIFLYDLKTSTLSVSLQFGSVRFSSIQFGRRVVASAPVDGRARCAACADAGEKTQQKHIMH